MRLFLASIVSILLFVGIVPILAMLIKAFMPDDTIPSLFGSMQTWMLMRHSVILASLVTVSTFLLGIPLGIFLGKTDLPFRRFFIFLFLIPLLVPPYIIAVAWSDLFQMSGLPLHWLSGLPGSLFILVSVYLPLPMLLTMIFLHTVHPHLEEAGRLVATWPLTLWRVTLPLIRPALLLAALLVFLLALGEFSVPMYLRYNVYAVESFTQFSAFYNFEAATAAAIPLVLFAALLTVAENRYLRNRIAIPRHFAQKNEFLRITLGRNRWSVLTGMACLAAIFVAMPIGSLLLQAGGIDSYLRALHVAGDALLRSFFYAFVGASVLTFFGFFTGYLFLKKPFYAARTIDPLLLFLFTLPGTVIGIALITFWNTPSTNIVYATTLIVLFGYLAKYTALTARISLATLAMVPPSMEEAAQMTGAGWFQRMIHIVIPLTRHGILGAWVVASLFILRDISITILLYPPGHDTLPVRIFTLMANGSPQLIASLCIVMIAVVVVPAAVAWGWFHYWGTKR